MNIKMIYKPFLVLSLILFFGIFSCAYGQNVTHVPDIYEVPEVSEVPYVSKEAILSGKTLFNTHCSPCHGIHREKLGPMLAGITMKKSEQWLFAFIRNSQQVILSGDDYAGFLFWQYNQVVMPSFEKLSEREIRNILLYIEEESENPTEEAIRYPDEEIIYRYPQLMNGKRLFDTQCSSCHFIGKEGYGPPLGSLSKRLPRSWLIRFIQNSQEVIQEGDFYAVHLFYRYDQKVMPPFEYLSPEDITSILEYIDFVSSSPPYVAGVNGRKIITPPASEVYVGTGPVTEDEKGEKDETPLIIAFVIISVLGAIVHGYLVLKLFRYLLKDTR